MKIREVNENKKQFIALLLLADEQENMIDHYLEKGTMYVLEDGNVKAECVVTDEDNGILEIKNIYDRIFSPVEYCLGIEQRRPLSLAKFG